MNALRDAARDLLYREALFLDTQRWDDWLALYTVDCEYWVPAWKAAHQVTEDPKREISLIYYASRAGLEDRVWRVRSGRSVASKPLPRTQHVLSNILVESLPPDDSATGGAASGCVVNANWTVHQFMLKSREVQVLFGRSEYRLVESEGTLQIARRKSILLNDLMPAMLDFYSL